MPSIQLAWNPKRIIVQWVGIGTHTHTFLFSLPIIGWICLMLVVCCYWERCTSIGGRHSERHNIHESVSSMLILCKCWAKQSCPVRIRNFSTASLRTKEHRVLMSLSIFIHFLSLFYMIMIIHNLNIVKWCARRAGSDGSMCASGSAGLRFDLRWGSKFSFEKFSTSGLGGMEMYTF